MPDLSGIPPLTSWVKLRGFIAYVVEEKQGKLLRAELNQLLKAKKLSNTENNFFSVSKLKSKLWYMGEGNSFFASWSDKSGIKAYKLAVKEVSSAKTENEVKETVFKFIELINILPNIETTEREDVWDAIHQLVKACHLDISKDQVAEWFNEVRDF